MSSIDENSIPNLDAITQLIQDGNAVAPELQEIFSERGRGSSASDLRRIGSFADRTGPITPHWLTSGAPHTLSRERRVLSESKS